MPNPYKTSMNKDLNYFNNPTPPADLYEKIVFRVQREEVKSASIRSVFQGCITLASFVFAFPIFINVLNGFSQSGFWQYFSLIFTDSAVVITHFQTFLTSLVESTPFYEITIFLVVLFIFLGSIKYVSENLRQVALLKKLA